MFSEFYGWFVLENVGPQINSLKLEILFLLVPIFFVRDTHVNINCVCINDTTDTTIISSMLGAPPIIIISVLPKDMFMSQKKFLYLKLTFYLWRFQFYAFVLKSSQLFIIWIVIIASILVFLWWHSKGIIFLFLQIFSHAYPI